MYKSYHYDNMPRPIPAKREVEPTPAKKSSPEKTNNFLGDLKNDDIILLVIIFILLIDDCDDKLLLIALGFIFFSGFGE